MAGLISGTFGVAGYLVDIGASRAVIPYTGLYTDPLKAIVGEPTGSTLRAAWIALAQPWSYGGDATVPALCVFVAVALAALSFRLVPKFQLLPLALLGSAALCSIWWNFTDYTLVTGLLATMPLLFFGIFCVRFVDIKRSEVQVLALVCLVGLAGLLATIYGDGGAAQGNKWATGAAAQGVQGTRGQLFAGA